MDGRQKYCMVKFNDELVCIDNSIELFRLLGKKYTIMIMTLLANNKLKNQNFNEIVNDLPGSDKTLISLRIKQLTKFGIIERKSYGNITYELTDRGNEILRLILPLFRKMQYDQLI